MSGVANGYLNNETATNKNFVKNPFGKGMIYRTGDLGKYRQDGDLDYVDRLDNQIKIRGQRIELGEIEDKILKISSINSCAVIKISKDSHEFLSAYYTADSNVDPSIIRKHLGDFLPKYMIPSYFMQMEKLPYTTNGKIDRKKLPEPQYVSSSKGVVNPRNETDKRLLELLKEILKIDNINMNDSFFDLGGDSLLAINLSLKIQSEFNSTVLVKDILSNPIVEQISDLISRNAKQSQKLAIRHVPDSEYYPASSSQKRIYFSSQLAGKDSILYNSAGGIIIDGHIDIAKLENCFKTLITRHEAFRTYFELIDGNIVQKIISNVDFKL